MEITLRVIKIPEERYGRIIFNCEVAFEEGGNPDVILKGLKFNRGKAKVEYPQHRGNNYQGQTAGLSEPLLIYISDLLDKAVKKYRGQMIPPITITPDMLSRHAGVGKEGITADSLMK